MMISLFGPPSGFVQWGVHVTRVISEIVLRDVDYVNTCEVGVLREAFSKRSQPHVFFFSDCPDQAIVDIFLKTRSKGIVLYEEPDDVTGFIHRERDMNWYWASRLTAQCLMTVVPLIHSGHFLLLKRGQHKTFRQFLTAVMDFFNLEADADQVNTIVERLSLTGSADLDADIEDALLGQWAHARPIGAATLDADDAMARTVGHMNNLTRCFVERRITSPIIWPSEYFIPGDAPNEILSGEINLLGPARCVCFGPYLHLPVGDWRVEVDIEVKENISGNRIEIDVYHDGVIAVESFRLPSEGQFRSIAHFTITDPRNAIQFRFILKEGAIEGKLKVGSARIFPDNEEIQNFDEAS